MSKVNTNNEKNINDNAKKELNRLFEDLFVKKLSDKASEVYEISKSVHKDVPEKVNLSVKLIGDKIDICQKDLQASISEATGLTDSVDTKVAELQIKMEAIETKTDDIKKYISDSLDKANADFDLQKKETNKFHSENYMNIIKEIEQSSRNEINKLAEHKEMIENNIKTYVTDLYNKSIERINNTEKNEKRRFILLLSLLIANSLFSLALLLWFILQR